MTKIKCPMSIFLRCQQQRVKFSFHNSHGWYHWNDGSNAMFIADCAYRGDHKYYCLL